MILINNIWYSPKDLSDVSVIIRELFNCELADKMDELIELNNNELTNEIAYKNDEIDDLKDYINDLRDEIRELNDELEKVRDELDEIKEGARGE